MENDKEYFELLTQEQWQVYVDRVEAHLHEKFGYGLHFRMRWMEWKRLNYVND